MTLTTLPPPHHEPVAPHDLRARVTDVLLRFIDDQDQILRDVDPELSTMTTALREFVLSSGKRLRSTFCYWGWRGAGGAPDDEGILVAASALELLQGCALIHDDVMDSSDTRRGLPTMHRRFARWHRLGDLHGSPEEFGTSVAILLGDLCLSWCAQMFDGCGLSEAAISRAKPAFHQMHTELMAGQYLDLLGPARGGGSSERARLIIDYKTARYTVGRPLELGALLADGGPELRARYAAYARPLGEAFQLRDDVLGVFGDTERTGKPAGDDLRAGKHTVMMDLTRSRATAAQRAVLDALFGNPDLDRDGIGKIQDIIRETGALASVNALIEEHRTAALSHLTDSLLETETQATLTELAITVTNRDY
ncbi:polyprenyl synthetase family protein [Allokutzneria oryzae]|uniref:Polyprenyl synthetase family protein n=1 Tax=Allokutzneria oryzae TaxID=1378989 RepID=A0ABV6A789_9PSEU